MPNVEKQDQEMDFGQSFGALINYSMTPPQFMLMHGPRDAQEVGSPEVLERIVTAERNDDALSSRTPQQLAERLQLASLDVDSLAKHSLWEALKYVTRLVVDVELATLRAGYLRAHAKLDNALEGQSEVEGRDFGPITETEHSQDGARQSPYKDLHDLLAKYGVVASIVELTESSQLRRWIEMCDEPQSLLIAYRANATFDRGGDTMAGSVE